MREARLVCWSEWNRCQRGRVEASTQSRGHFRYTERERERFEDLKLLSVGRRVVKKLKEKTLLEV